MQKNPMQKWEYRVESLGMYKELGQQKQLNGFGDNGWELVNVVTITDGYGQTTEFLCYLKRPLDTNSEDYYWQHYEEFNK